MLAARRRRPATAAVLFAVAFAWFIPTLGAEAQQKNAHKPPPAAAPPAPPVATALPPPESKAYDPQLMRLAEILGALSYLRGLCGSGDADDWRRRMQALLDAEGVPAVRRDRLAGAFNQGFNGYELFYRTCTPNARLVIERFLAEGGRLAQDLENRYRAS